MAERIADCAGKRIRNIASYGISTALNITFIMSVIGIIGIIVIIA